LESSSETEKIIRCRHILVKHAGSRRPSSWKSKDQITRTLEQATDIIKDYRRRITNNEIKFEAIAQTESDCASHSAGGDLGRFGRGKMQKPFEEAAFCLKVGDISGPVFTESGVHIILRTE